MVVKQDSQETPCNLHHQRDWLGSSTYAVVEADKVSKNRMDSLVIAPWPPFERPSVEGCCLMGQMDHALQMDLGQVLHTLPADLQIYMPLHRISY